MTQTLAFLMLLCEATYLASPQQKELSVLRGDLYHLKGPGVTERLTHDLVNSQPFLSSDRTRLVFVKIPREGGAAGELLTKHEIWMMPMPPDRAARRLVESPVTVNGRKFDRLFCPSLSPDNASLYFMIPFGAVTHGLMRFDLQRGDLRFVTAALEYVVVPNGPLAGHIIARIRKSAEPDGYNYHYWLLTQEGVELRQLGSELREVAEFLQENQKPIKVQPQLPGGGRGE